MAKSAKNNTLKLKFESSRNLAPAPESKSIAKISERYDLFINGKFEKPLSKKYFSLAGKNILMQNFLVLPPASL